MKKFLLFCATIGAASSDEVVIEKKGSVVNVLDNVFFPVVSSTALSIDEITHSIKNILQTPSNFNGQVVGVAQTAAQQISLLEKPLNRLVEILGNGPFSQRDPRVVSMDLLSTTRTIGHNLTSIKNLLMILHSTATTDLDHAIKTLEEAITTVAEATHGGPAPAIGPSRFPSIPDTAVLLAQKIANEKKAVSESTEQVFPMDNKKLGDDNKEKTYLNPMSIWRRNPIYEDFFASFFKPKTEFLFILQRQVADFKALGELPEFTEDLRPAAFITTRAVVNDFFASIDKLLADIHLISAETHKHISMVSVAFALSSSLINVETLENELRDSASDSTLLEERLHDAKKFRAAVPHLCRALRLSRSKKVREMSVLFSSEELEKSAERMENATEDDEDSVKCPLDLMVNMGDKFVQQKFRDQAQQAQDLIQIHNMGGSAGIVNESTEQQPSEMSYFLSMPPEVALGVSLELQRVIAAIEKLGSAVKSTRDAMIRVDEEMFGSDKLTEKQIEIAFRELSGGSFNDQGVDDLVEEAMDTSFLQTGEESNQTNEDSDNDARFIQADAVFDKKDGEIGHKPTAKEWFAEEDKIDIQELLEEGEPKANMNKKKEENKNMVLKDGEDKNSSSSIISKELSEVQSAPPQNSELKTQPLKDIKKTTQQVVAKMDKPWGVQPAAEDKQIKDIKQHIQSDISKENVDYTQDKDIVSMAAEDAKRINRMITSNMPEEEIDAAIDNYVDNRRKDMQAANIDAQFNSANKMESMINAAVVEDPLIQMHKSTEDSSHKKTAPAISSAIGSIENQIAFKLFGDSGSEDYLPPSQLIQKIASEYLPPGTEIDTSEQKEVESSKYSLDDLLRMDNIPLQSVTPLAKDANEQDLEERGPDGMFALNVLSVLQEMRTLLSRALREQLENDASPPELVKDVDHAMEDIAHLSTMAENIMTPAQFAEMNLIAEHVFILQHRVMHIDALKKRSRNKMSSVPSSFVETKHKVSETVINHQAVHANNDDDDDYYNKSKKKNTVLTSQNNNSNPLDKKKTTNSRNKTTNNRNKTNYNKNKVYQNDEDEDEDKDKDTVKDTVKDKDNKDSKAELHFVEIHAHEHDVGVERSMLRGGYDTRI